MYFEDGRPALKVASPILSDMLFTIANIQQHFVLLLFAVYLIVGNSKICLFSFSFPYLIMTAPHRIRRELRIFNFNVVIA